MSNVLVLNQTITDKYAIYNGDNVEIIKGIPDNSIHYQLMSPPFAALFVYSNSPRDQGNAKNDDEFMKHFRFLLPEMHRVCMPGRLVSFHCMSIPAMKERDGYIGIKDFSGDIIRECQKVGFIFHSRVVIPKDPLIEAMRTKAIGLAHKQICKDSSRCRQGLPDYVINFVKPDNDYETFNNFMNSLFSEIITMIKPGENLEPVKHENGFESYCGSLPESKGTKTKDQSKNKYSHEIWRRYAEPVWNDIRQTNTLNTRLAKEKNDERHICPLQLDTIERCIQLWTNENDIVADWFSGIGSTGFKSIEMNRRYIGIELKKTYYDVSIKNLSSLDNNKKQLKLF